jgi:hypothetical protein
MLNRVQFRTQHPYRPIVRYDIFPNSMPSQGRIIGAEKMEQLPLPMGEAEATLKTFSTRQSRTRKKQVRDFVYVPYEESA